MIRLPTPGSLYDPSTIKEAFRAIETVLRQLLQSTDALPDPSISLNNFRIIEETDDTITYGWTPGAKVTGVWVYELEPAAPLATDPWAALPVRPSHTLNRTTTAYTIQKPRQGFYHLAQFEPRLANGQRGKVKRVQVNPAQASFSVSLTADVTNDVADLVLEWTAGKADLPLRLRVYEEHPVDPPLLDVTVEETSGVFTKIDHTELGARALPQRALERWWVLATNTAGVELWFGPTAADRDPLPNGAVTATANTIRCEYDDDTDAIRVTVPGGRTKTWTGLSGGGVRSYTVGDALDNATSEGSLTLDEVRDGYLVEFQGGGQWLTFWRGALRGPQSPHATAVLRASVTGATADLTLQVDGSAPCFPCTASVYEDSPFATPLTSQVFSGPGSSSGGILAGRALPLNELKKWWVKITDPNGTDRWWGPTAADRDSIPGGEVTAAEDTLRCVYDDDTDQVQITVPGGRTRTFSGLSGGGSVSYTVGSSILDNSTFEVPLAADEVRDGYTVTYSGGGATMTFFSGKLRGPNKDFTPPTLEVTLTALSDRYTVAYTSSGTVESRVDGGAWVTAPSSPFDVFRLSSDRTLQMRATGTNGAVCDPRTFTIPALPPTDAAAAPTFKDVSSVLWDDIANQVRFQWTYTGTPSAQFDVYVADGGSTFNYAGTTSGSSYVFSSFFDLTFNPSDPTATIRAYVVPRIDNWSGTPSEPFGDSYHHS